MAEGQGGNDTLSESQLEDLEELRQLLPDRAPEEIKKSLKKFQHMPDRRERVGSDLIFNGDNTTNGEVQNAQVVELLEVFPNKSRAELEEVLSNFEGQDDALPRAIDFLMNQSADSVGGGNATASASSNSVILLNGSHSANSDINDLRQMFPNKSEEEISTVLAEVNGSEDKITRAIDRLVNANESNSSISANSANVDPMDYVQEIVQRFPKADPNVVFERFEKAQQEGKLLETVKETLIKEFTPPVIPAEIIDVAGPSRVNPVPIGRLSTNDITAFLSVDQKSVFDNIMQMFTDVDPKWVVSKLTQEEGSTENLVQRMFEEPNCYDKLKTRQARELTERRRDNMLDFSKFNVAHFLQVFPNPQTHFADETSTKSHLYIDHAVIVLQNDFPNIRLDYLRNVLTNHNNHLYPAYKELREHVENHTTPKGPGPPRKKPRVVKPKEFMKKVRSVEAAWPTNTDEAFFKELQYARWENIVTQHETNEREEKERRLVEARENGTLMECQCCYLDECLPDEMIFCTNKHSFCSQCVVQAVETKLGEGHHKLDCLAGDCDHTYPPSVLRHILNATVFNRLIRNMQQHELREAKMDNLFACPFCDFAMIIDNPNERIFTCLNPDCLKVSCRECKEENHIPLRCEEVEKNDETKMRTYIEEQCAAAMIRKCPNCQKPIIKDSGCNKMTCACGTYFCYVCSAELDKANPYGHFRDTGAPGTNNGICAATTSMAKVHEEVALKAAKEAKEKYLKDNPHLKEKNRVDVKTLVDNTKGQVFGGDMDEYDEGEDEDYDEEDGDYDDDGGFVVPDDDDDRFLVDFAAPNVHYEAMRMQLAQHVGGKIGFEDFEEDDDDDD